MTSETEKITDYSFVCFSKLIFMKYGFIWEQELVTLIFVFLFSCFPENLFSRLIKMVKYLRLTKKIRS